MRSVQCLTGDAMWHELEQSPKQRALFNESLSVIDHASGDPREDKEAVLFKFEYADGFQGRVYMLPTYARGTSVALALPGQSRPVATRFDERTEPRYPHFAFLLRAIEKMMHTGKPTYPVERTLLTSGVLDRALTSLHESQRRIDTPELLIQYEPVDYPGAY